MPVPLDIERANADLAGQPPEAIVSWALTTFGPARVAVQSSMQKTAGVLMHMAGTLAPGTAVLFVDTGVHFPETLELRDGFASRYGLNMITGLPERTFDEQFEDFGRQLYETDDRPEGAPPGYQECCRLRKEVPYLAVTRGRFDAVLGGLTRAEGGVRKSVAIVAFDPRIDAYKINPLAEWDGARVDAYTAEHGVPVHPLYARGYTSIGCWTCTTPTAPGEHPRAGRWRHLNQEGGGTPMYCGINLEDRMA